MYKKHILILLFHFALYIHIYPQQACSIAPIRKKTVTEFFYQSNKTVVFSCKVISSNVILSSGEASSIVEIENIYFGTTNLKEVKIITGAFPPSGLPSLLTKPVKALNPEFMPGGGYELGGIVDRESTGGNGTWGFKMQVGSTYLIYANDTAHTQNYNTTYSKPFKEGPQIKDELEILKTFDGIFKQKETGHFVFKNDKGYILAEGNYKKGKPTGIWKHYDENGRIVIETDLKNNSTKEYYESGCLKSITTICKDSTITESYVNKEYNPINYRIVEIKKDTCLIMITSMYDNGHIMDKTTQLDVYAKNGRELSGMGYHGSYQEFYLNGKVKLNALYLFNRRVGCWTWYNTDGKFWAEWDYKDGKAPQ